MSKGDETRERILSEAAALFNQHGFEGGSLSELMKATGLEKGGIYRHFSSKEELATEAFDYAWKVAIETRMRDLESIPNSVDKLKHYIANFVVRGSSVPGGCPLLNTAIDTDDGNPVLRERALKALRDWRDRLAAIISAGIKRKEIRQRHRCTRTGDPDHFLSGGRTDDEPPGTQSGSPPSDTELSREIS